MMMQGSNGLLMKIFINPRNSSVSADFRRSLPPGFSRCKASAFGERRELCPNDIGVDGGLADPRAVAAIRSRDHILASDAFGVAPDALRDQVRVLDEVGF